MIRKAGTITGRLIDPRTVKLDEAVGDAGDRVELTLHATSPVKPSNGQSIIEYLESLPPGNRSKADIDAQIAEERSSWGD